MSKLKELLLTKKKIRVANFDIGTVNFAHFVDDFRVSSLKRLSLRYSSLPKKKQRKTGGPMIPEIQRILNRLYKCSKRIDYGLKKIRFYDIKNCPIDIKTRIKLFDYLDEKKDVWDLCDAFIIEQQYFKTFSPKGKKNKGSEANIIAIKLAECVCSYFLMNYPDKITDFIPSDYKVYALGCPRKMTKAKRKKWSEVHMKEKLLLQGDKELYDIASFKHPRRKKGEPEREKIKWDDIADMYNQSKAFAYMYIICENYFE
jgi:hypothetical protein